MSKAAWPPIRCKMTIEPKLLVVYEFLIFALFQCLVPPHTVCLEYSRVYWNENMKGNQIMVSSGDFHCFALAHMNFLHLVQSIFFYIEVLLQDPVQVCVFLLFKKKKK